MYVVTVLKIPDSALVDREGMLRGAELAHVPASSRLLTDWIQIGLVAPPQRPGRGRGRGRVGTWTAAQRRMFTGLLEKRKETTSIAALLCIPVWTWLWWGDRYVPLVQLRRALRSWTDAALGSNIDGAARAARQCVRMIRHAESAPDDRARLRRLLSRWTYGEDVDETELREAIHVVVDPYEEDGVLGPLATPVDAGAVADWIIGTRRAARALRATGGAEQVPDWLLHWARWAYLDSQHGYVQDQPMLARHPRWGAYFPQTTEQDLILNACQHLVGVIAIGSQLATEDGDGSFEHPSTWRDRRRISEILETREIAGGLKVTFRWSDGSK